MIRVLGIILVVAALVIGIVPQFTDCQSQGRSLTLDNGKTIPMKCHWTARAEWATAFPLVAVGAMMGFSRRKESGRILAIMGIVLGLFAILLPTALIGVCSTAMVCNLTMRPLLIFMGIVTIAVSVVGLMLNERRAQVIA
jgi:hypothetical protein